MMGGWLIWLVLGGLFLYLMFRGGGCYGGHGSRGGGVRDSHDGRHDGSGPGNPVNPGDGKTASY